MAVSLFRQVNTYIGSAEKGITYLFPLNCMFFLISNVMKILKNQEKPLHQKFGLDSSFHYVSFGMTCYREVEGKTTAAKQPLFFHNFLITSSFRT